MKKRRTHQPDFKARIALEAIKGIKTVAEIAKDHTIHPVQVSEWKKTLQDKAPEAFGKVRDDSSEALAKQLSEAKSMLGSLMLDLEYLKKKCATLGLVIEPDSLTGRTLS
jgi:transposase-like protein